MLDNFFKINFPYGMEKINGEWNCFNREYQTIGYSRPYPKLTEKRILLIAQQIHRNNEGEITKFWLYGDDCNPSNSGSKIDWKNYCEKIRVLASLRLDNNKEVIIKTRLTSYI